jgi:NAD(P)-dependent dehydrogenase (short-subunit alcohol dehydrogenase family)
MTVQKSAASVSFAHDLFAGQRVLVSGGSSGIGLEIARGFRDLGAHVVATGSSQHKLTHERIEASNAGIVFAHADLRDHEGTERLIANFDRLDVLVNAAGIARPEAEFELAVFEDVMDINLTATMRTAMAAREHLIATGGSIINFASMLSFLADASVPAYTASKTGLMGLTRALAHAFGPEGVRVNAIAPGYHKTDMTKPLWSQPHNHDVIARHAALKRWGTTSDLVGATVFLASPAAQFITGVCLPVDGGYSVGAATG